MNPYFKELIQNRFRIVNIVWLAMMASSLIFGFLLFSKPAAQGAPPLAALATEPFVQVLAVAAVLAIAASRYLAGMMLARPKLEALRRQPWTAESLAAEKREGASVYTPEMIPKLLEFSERERLHFLAFGPYFTSKIISFALAEAPSIMGFLVANQYHQPQAYLPFVALAFVGFLLARPSESELANLLN